jgi:hypothetical protein
MLWASGTQLHPADREQVLRSYMYRMTIENVRRNPQATATMLKGGYRAGLVSDATWLANTRFAVRKNGRLDQRSQHCESNVPLSITSEEEMLSLVNKAREGLTPISHFMKPRNVS